MTDIKPVLIVMTSHGTKGENAGDPTGFYLSEVTHPLKVFHDASIPVEFASIEGGEPPVDGLELDDATNNYYWNDEAFRNAVRTTRRLRDIDASRYSAIFFAGGHGAMWDFPKSEAVVKQIRAVWAKGGIVSAVCHGPAALANATLEDGSHLVAGKNVSAFTDSEEQAVGLQEVVPFLLSSTLASRGAHMKAGADWTSTVSVDGRLVTGQNPQSATAVGEAVRDLLLA